jgi:hypothetical protein
MNCQLLVHLLVHCTTTKNITHINTVKSVIHLTILKSSVHVYTTQYVHYKYPFGDII